MAETTNEAQSVTQSLDMIGPQSMAMTIQKGGKKIERVVASIPEDQIDEGYVELDERLAPLASELELMKNRCIEQAEEMVELRRRLQEQETKAAEVPLLRQSVAAARSDWQVAVQERTQATAVLSRERAENARLQQAVQTQVAGVRAKEEEVEKLQGKLTRRDKRLALLEKKLKVLTRTMKHPRTAPAEDPDDSLQIENSVEIVRKSNDWIDKRLGGGDEFVVVDTFRDVVTSFMPHDDQPEEPKPRSKWLPITLPKNRRTRSFCVRHPDVPLASTNADLPSTSYASPKDWDDDDNWGVPPTKLDPNDKFNPALHTVRAFGIATAIVGTLAFGGIWGLREYLGVDNMDDLSAEFRLGVMNRMPNLAEKMRNALQFGSSSEEPDPAAGGDERSPWTWDEAQDRLAAAYDKGGIEAWANVAAQEVADEAKLEMKRREELQKR
ncbi:unnamed protein product [Mycena citricolor]|uniref:Uncharacterized protein n=1 Tax=Mycena citricolor TaxID=2018698 RepID=A0AAD2JVB7_9AGAR|nr:unnamed protein product [Mycena citricolor]